MLRKALILALLLVPMIAAGVSAQVPERISADTMKAALRTAAPEDNGFIDRVVGMADMGDLSRAILNGTFRWACKKPVRYRFQYFRRGLIIRAARAGTPI